MLIALLIGCEKSSEPLPEPQPQLIPINPIANSNWMTFTYNGNDYKISLMTNKNGYTENEVVTRGSGVGLKNTLMLTFKLAQSGNTQINKDMTGYWDLGLCIPFNKYLLTNDAGNYIEIESYDVKTNIISGEFNLKFKFEKDTTKSAVFSNGRFNVKIDTSYSFHYCIEG